MAVNEDGSLNRDKHGFDAPASVDHPARTNIPDGHPAGPAIGERLPDFVLPDAQGRKVDFHNDRGGAKSAVVFYRSAVW
ncbi:MAG: hypothetical protein HOK30_23715 [Rhodospirillaceae bacterium]|jgi:hypothetical protein|nr:hypothetical protein [Rhodospirillaceae bacterium]MBT5896795.1 hypothetical protein [Rhodospirillaceae bacterium]MBT6430695.1 hypothetical protein [Rhodospirillaceae bacterium]MBT7757925.1 hypothetical protein [Rhodospirillaceae bacterium]